MTTAIKKLDEVWTSDDVRLGIAHRLFHRSADVNPELQLYGSYLQVKNFDVGDDYYVPTDYIASRDPASGRIRLTVPFQTAMAQTWTRLPQFALTGLARQEELAESEGAAV
jgi:hypothetical protein